MDISRGKLISALNEPEKILVYSFGCTPTMGFGADYLGLTHKLMSCLHHGVGFRLCKITRPRGFITKYGWSDYFSPFCGEVEGAFLERLNRGTFPYAKKLPVIKPLARLWLRTFSSPKADYFTFDSLGPISQLGPPIFRPGEDYLAARRDLIALLWSYNVETAEEVEEIKREIDVGNNFAAICVRRGDKTIEYAYVGLDKYVDLLNSLELDSRRIFVATDDFSVVKEIAEAMPEFEFISLTEPSSKGYVHFEFKALTASERRRRTVRFFAQLELLRDAAVFLGSKTTNVSWFANAHRGGNGVLWVD